MLTSSDTPFLHKKNGNMQKGMGSDIFVLWKRSLNFDVFVVAIIVANKIKTIKVRMESNRFKQVSSSSCYNYHNFFTVINWNGSTNVVTPGIVVVVFVAVQDSITSIIKWTLNINQYSELILALQIIFPWKSHAPQLFKGHVLWCRFRMCVWMRSPVQSGKNYADNRTHSSRMRTVFHPSHLNHFVKPVFRHSALSIVRWCCDTVLTWMDGVSAPQPHRICGSSPFYTTWR